MVEDFFLQFISVSVVWFGRFKRFLQFLRRFPPEVFKTLWFFAHFQLDEAFSCRRYGAKIIFNLFPEYHSGNFSIFGVGTFTFE
jgi:hypothetical protein